MVQRREGWEVRLHAHITWHRRVPFVWGRNDCVTFAAGAVAALDPMWRWPVTWSDKGEARRQLSEIGGIEAAACLALGQPADDWRRCGRGDVALVCKGNWPSLAVCTGMTLCAPAIAGGLAFVPRREAIKVWKVG